MLSIEQAHARDYEDQRRMDDLRRTIEAFLKEPPSRCHRFTREGLQNACDNLWEDHQRISKVWD